MNRLIILMFTAMNFFHQNLPSLPEIRPVYLQAVSEENSSQKLLALLGAVKATDDPVLVCYKGVSIMIAAKYIRNPFQKLRSFNAGKKLIEAAMERDKDNVEIHYLRYSIQCSIPSFLGYCNNVNTDRAFLVSQMSLIKDEDLQILVSRMLNFQTSNRK